MKKSIVLLLLAIIPCFCFSQKHDFIRFWGYDNEHFNLINFGGATINFNTSPPLIYPEKKKIDISFYAAVCSDSSGQLAFYTNGISIRDASHNVMLNGDTINPGPFWEQFKNDAYPNGPFCFALPAPVKHNFYYLFHMGSEIANSAFVTSPFYFSLVDMNGHNGLGEVVKKNQIILPENKDYIAPVAVKHGNGRDWWIITGEVSTPYLYTFLLDSAGVHGPFTTVMPYQFPGLEYQSINAMSPDGKTYVRSDGSHGLYIFDFDRCNGDFDNLRVLPFPDQEFFGFATVFAPDSKHLYLSSWTLVTVLDLTANDISASLDTMAYFDGKASPFEPFVTGFFIPCLGPDGKIYYSTTNGTLSWHIIHDPTLPGLAADVEQHGITLPKFNDGTMVQFPNYRLGEWDDSPCDTLNGQKPGDGFIKSVWFPPTIRKPEGYTQLAPLFNSVKTSPGKPEHRKSIAEMAIEQSVERRKHMEINNNNSKN